MFNLSSLKFRDVEEIFQSYVAFHNNMTKNKVPPNFILFTAPTGGEGTPISINLLEGLGNSLDGVSFAFLVAILSGNTVCLLTEQVEVSYLISPLHTIFQNIFSFLLDLIGLTISI